ncbi:F510_1955 family glycosylhydrolase [Salimicrobium flavidum]|uniref:Sortilin, neurotensin receptor 3 n=1 Tax=Salimicrobium flavidum TaxID=570947 RepID=A0A1N7JFC4_9BACI|nr:hypothetical protein [Salimicrobium flavidum]SIS48072.1 hypothetical protein SAMN05421687_105211 [Salimicrobium flavidum]
MKKISLLWFSAMVIFLAACGGEESETENQAESDEDKDQTSTEDVALEEFEGTIEHVHGMGYTDAEGITFASHQGLKIFREGEWMETPFHNNDYMGFNAIENGMYVSGHPGEDTTDLENPIGLQKGKATKEGLENLGFEGGSDFHILGVGYENEAIYLLNSQPDPELDTGFHRSFDQGESFERMAAENLPGDVFQLAVHPVEETVVAAATKSGVYLSTDSGDTFERVSEQGQASGLSFTEDQLYFALLQEEASFKTYDWESEEVKELPLPDFGEDAVMYSASHPENSEVAIYTMNGSSYVTDDEGETWTQILDNGTVK